MNSIQAKTGVEVERLPELPKLPPLPESDYTLTEQSGVLDKVTAREFAVFTEYSMREYARTAIAAERAEAVRMREENEKLRAALEEYDEKLTAWASAYPLEVFPEPDLKKVHALLQAEGMTLDAVSASNMRHVAKGLSELFQPVRAALSPSQGGTKP